MKRILTAAVLAASPAVAEDVTVALDWTPNTNHVGLYVAQAKGWYEETGLEVEILPYTDTASSTLVANGVAEFGVLTSLGFYTQRAAGADLVGLYAIMQHETGRVVFNADRDDIKTPADLDGLVYAGFGTGWEQALLETMIQAAGGTGEFETVTLGTSAYEALAAGRVDFTLEVAHWEGVAAELLGRDQKAFIYADYGVPDQHGGYIGGRGAWLEANADTADAFVDATARGYAFAADNPVEAAQILVAASDGMLTNPDLVEKSMQVIVDKGLLVTEAGEVGVIDPEKFETMGTFLFENGILRDGSGAPLADKPLFADWVSAQFLD